MGEVARTTYVLVDGENIDATLGTSILGRRPRPEERPRWERLLQFARERWDQPAQGLFFLAANTELPMTFVQALLAIGYRPVPLSGGPGEKVVDIAIQRTLVELGRREADVMLVSNDGDFVEQVDGILDGRRVGVIGFVEFRTAPSSRWSSAGWSRSTWSTTCWPSTSGCPGFGSSRSTSSTRPSSSEPVRRGGRRRQAAPRRWPAGVTGDRCPHIVTTTLPRVCSTSTCRTAAAASGSA